MSTPKVSTPKHAVLVLERLLSVLGRRAAAAKRQARYMKGDPNEIAEAAGYAEGLAELVLELEPAVADAQAMSGRPLESRLARLESKLAQITPNAPPGTLLSRSLIPGGDTGWVLGIGSLPARKAFFYGETIEEVVSLAEAALLPKKARSTLTTKKQKRKKE